MKHILTPLLLLFSIASFAQDKVVERSQKKEPSWLHAVEQGYIIANATGSDMNEAQNALLSNIKQKIAESIAQRVVAETDMNSVQQEYNGQFDYKQRYESSVKTKTANLPFLSEISLSKASEYYWEKRQGKSSKSYYYFYAIKYPFSDFDMKKLVNEYKEHEAKLNIKLEKFENDLNNISTVEEIDKNIIDLQAFVKEFQEEDPRYAKVESLNNRYRRLYDYITISAYQSKKGVVMVSLFLNDRQINTQQKANIRSNCATKISAASENNQLAVKFDDFGCYDDDENYIEIRYRFGNKNFSERAYFKTAVSTSLTGVITNASTNEPVAYSKITLIPSGKSTVSGRDGLYQFNDLPAGTYSIQVMAANYSTISVDTNIPASGGVRRDISLTPKATNNTPREGLYQPQSVTPQPTHGKDPMSTVRNGLYAYFRFEGDTRDALGSNVNGQLINSPNFTNDSKDGSQAITLNAANGSYISFPQAMIQLPVKQYSVSFWIKGASDGHIFSVSTGSNAQNDNFPRLIMEDYKFKLINNNNYENNIAAFSHAAMSYDWHMVTVTVAPNTNGGMTSIRQMLYIDGELVDNIIDYRTNNSSQTKFIFGGKSNMNHPAVSMTIDNLRIYNGRELTPAEVREIYQAESIR